MMRSDAAVRWLWTAPSPAARVARASLVPAAAAYAAYIRARATGYRHGLLTSRSTGAPTIAVGNLSVGGTGKTPIASWIAARCTGLGRTPGIVLRGYGGGDEIQVHRERLPEAIVVEGRDRLRAAQQAIDLGAKVIVLDDAFQRMDVRRDLNILLLSADIGNRMRQTLPAGPWREPSSAMRRADLVIVTRKRASPEAAQQLARLSVSCGAPPGRFAVAHLALVALTTLEGHVATDLAALRGANVLAFGGVADPQSLAHQLGCQGALVKLVDYPDHHRYTERDVQRLCSVAARFDYVVTTHKDAVKLRGRWPCSEPTVLVSHLEPQWEQGGGLVASLINDLLTRHYTPGMY